MRFRVFCTVLVATALTARVAGQHVLIVEHHDRPEIVRAVHGSTPYVEIGGKLVAASISRYVLKEVPEYLPVFVSIRNLQVTDTAMQFVGSSAMLNRELQFRAQFVSAFPLENVFMLVEFELEHDEHTIFLSEIGRLVPNVPRQVNFVVPLESPLHQSRYQLHLFSDGAELLHSEQPFAYREAMLNRIVAKRIANRPDGPPAPFIGPPPEYPAKLAATHPKGHAVVRLHILPTGAISDPEVVSATDPAFGEAALDALRQWRFFPGIKHGRPVATTVNLPVDFVPPDDAGSKP